jgi:hypothetical protein
MVRFQSVDSLSSSILHLHNSSATLIAHRETDTTFLRSTMLYEVLWNLVEKYGINDDRLPTFDTDGVPVDGRFLTMKLVMDGMAL